jgi:acetyl esterase/lipase
MASTASWARLCAVSGMIGMAYSNTDAADVHAVLRHVRHYAESLGIDRDRIGLWAASGNVPMALSVLMQDRDIACAALMYGYMLDWPGSTFVADTLKTWGFANPAAGKAIDALRPDLPLFIARAGLDHFPHLNTALDRFVADALARNMPLTLVNHATGRHAFDILEPTEASRTVIRHTLAFLGSGLGA